MPETFYAVPTGTLVNLSRLAYRHGLPHRHHQFSLLTRGRTAYVIGQRRTDYGGDFKCVLPVTGSDPQNGGMIWVGWLSVRAEDLPRLRRRAEQVTGERAVRVRDHVTAAQNLYTG